MNKKKTIKIYFLIFILSVSALNAKNVKDSKRPYREPKLSLQDNTIRARNMLGNLAVIQGTSDRINPKELLNLEKANYYNEKKAKTDSLKMDLELLKNKNLTLQNEIELKKIKK